jgi:2-polyprenyl-3-methyl-5-hydroxy-6-metoxy-1,4-benzoquinol methylase
VYDLFQRVLGARRLKQRFVEEFVVPFPGARVLDIGCGTANILEFLPSSIEYVGFDLNERYIAHARRKYNDRGTFFCQRVSQATVLRADEFDFVLAGGIVHHLNDEEGAKLFANAHSRLKPGGMLVTFDGVFVRQQSALARYIISKDRGMHVRTPEQYTRLARASFRHIETHIIHDLLRIPYSHLVMRCQKA